MLKKQILAGLAFVAAALSVTAAGADQPVPWQTRFQAPGSDMMAQITWFEAYTLWFIIPITLLVLGLLVWVMIRFRESANPVPSRTSHNSLIEVIWTVGPVVILLAIALPSFQILTEQLAPAEEPEITLKATGYQWYWGFEYQDGDEPLSFEAVLLKDGDRAGLGKEDKAVYPRLLAVDNEIVVPVDTMVRVLVTAADVIHAFAVPSFGVKVDAIPGRMNETWFKAQKEGLYYGQCSELCGKDHAFMPLAVRVVSRDQYDAWKSAAKTDISGANRALMAAIYGDRKVANAALAATAAN